MPRFHLYHLLLLLLLGFVLCIFLFIYLGRSPAFSLARAGSTSTSWPILLSSLAHFLLTAASRPISHLALCLPQPAHLLPGRSTNPSGRPLTPSFLPSCRQTSLPLDRIPSSPASPPRPPVFSSRCPPCASLVPRPLPPLQRRPAAISFSCHARLPYPSPDRARAVPSPATTVAPPFPRARSQRTVLRSRPSRPPRLAAL